MNNEIVLENANVSEKVAKLSFFTKLSYGLGSFSYNVMWSLAANYLLIFYTDVFGLAGTVAALILLVARVWDCFVDPVLGLIIERTNTKHGRFRPYIFYGAILLGIFNIMTFYTPSFDGTLKIVYAAIAYLVFGTLYSVVTIPHTILPTAMTTDLKERADLFSFGGFFGNISGVVTGAAVMPLILYLGHGNSQMGYFYTAVVLTVISVPLLFLTYANCREVVKPAAEDKPSIKDSLKAVATNKNVLFLYISLFCMFCGGAGKAGVLTYYCIYVLKNPALIAVVFTGFSAVGLISALLPQLILKYLDKKIALRAGLMIMGVCNFIVYFIPAEMIPVIVALNLIGFFPLGFNMVLLNGMVSDCVDDNHLKTGRRVDGAIFSFMAFVTKVGNAFIGSASLLALSAVGYVANAQQTPEAINGINMVTNVLPGIFLVIAVLPTFFYTITKEDAIETSRLLAEREHIN